MPTTRPHRDSLSPCPGRRGDTNWHQPQRVTLVITMSFCALRPSPEKTLWTFFLSAPPLLILLQTQSKNPLEVKSVTHMFSVFLFCSLMVAFGLIFILQASRRAQHPNLVGVTHKCTLHGFRDANSISLQLSTP